MTRILLVLLLVAGSPALWAQTDAGVDTLFMNDAAQSRRTGKVVGTDEQFIRLETQLGEGAKATVAVPRKDVLRIEFAPNEVLEQVLTTATVEDQIKVAALWERWRGFLDLPKSPTGRIGNVYAGLMLKLNDPAKAAEALELFTRIEEETWDDDARLAARQGRLRAMVATGNAAAAMEEAKEFAQSSDDPEVLIEAKFILASAAHESLRKLVDDNPRWDQDINVKPEYERLAHEALDLYLYAYLFYGSQADAAARGLWGATEIYQFTGDAENARESAKDLEVLYPGSPQAELAKAYLATLPDNQPDNEKEAQDEVTNEPNT